MISSIATQDYRCKKCNKLFFRGVLVDSALEVKCVRCGEMGTITGEEKDKFVCLKVPCANRVCAGTCEA